LTANPGSIASGSSTMLDWSATNADSCTASGGWTGDTASSGSLSTGVLLGNATFLLTCSGPGGSATQSVTVTVNAPAGPTTGTATLSWAAPTANTNGTPVTPLAGYHIYYGTSPSSLTQAITLTNAATTTYEITNLAAGTWFFAVAADAVDGSESALSNVESKTI
jgi:hypothetical protein